MTQPAPKSTPKPSRGLAGALFVLFALACGAGLTLDIAFNGAANAFWVGAEPGARALLGVGAAAFVVASAQIARLILAPRAGKDRDARDHP